ncbi:hypothetical protein [Amycolatopsis regifaucium]|uniref:Uncharacterized protein n=1 Tax=Amycolatopsis regifaucium TaxID=546365 RepID=A0A154MZ14_9PSEU|nr:hypothetical protein [Amycolatopsis regifaucium]KZB88709.1 hypothetical protein AVL48_01150 [Amycolatopsis regifaucium]OKA07119.1 hypothetical protein ATP06_0214635 [Amycolatopsis regifaucium]SFI57773.1 hypothetical protein SAMN04489731_111229 [Amycolatopsis regifaucium]
MVVIWILLGVLVLVIGIAVVTDLRDRGRGGTRKIMLPGWASRRADYTENDLVHGRWVDKSPREQEEELRRRYKSGEE